jgi:RNA polymerase sigma-70 factor (ECF subfamily)
MPDLIADSDEDLLRRATLGDEDAFTALYRRRQAGVYRFALHMCGREDVAEEVTQEVFLTLIRHPARFDSARGAVSSFLYGVARNHVLRYLERRKECVTIDDGEAAGEVPVPDGDALANLTREETIESVRQAVLSLPAGYREAVVLCDLEEMSYADAAGVLRVPVGTVRSRLNRGRGLLLDKLRAARPGAGALRCWA